MASTRWYITTENVKIFLFQRAHVIPGWLVSLSLCPGPTADNRAGKVQEVPKMTYDYYSPNSLRSVLNSLLSIRL